MYKSFLNDSLGQKLQGILRLTRWREHVAFVVPLTILGAVFAVQDTQLLDYRLLFVLLANIMAVSYAFMINDIEDAPDDSMQEDKRNRNPVASGLLDERLAWTSIRVVAAISLTLYFFVNNLTFVLGILTLLISHFYSWKPVRLKAWPVVDIVSHSLMLGGLLVITGFSAYKSQFIGIWALASTVTLGSAYGQLYNQLRDFDVDKRAGLKNTTLLLGEKKAKYLLKLFVLILALGISNLVLTSRFPIWLIYPAVLAGIFAWRYKKSSKVISSLDPGNAGSFYVQNTGLLILNLTVFFWLLEVLVQFLLY